MGYKLFFLLLLVSGTLNNRDISNVLNSRLAENGPEKGSWHLTDAFTSYWPISFAFDTSQQIKPPTVKIHLPKSDEGSYSWEESVRYSIDVWDEMDGDSKYDEIKGNEVLLEIEYLPIIKAGESNDEALKEKISESDTNPEHKGLSLLKKSTCFGCHADKAKHSGPSFYEIAARYDNSPANISTLAGHISGGSMGVWGSMEMPSHPELTEMETKQIAEYILAQGAEENRWVQPGLEGVFRIIKKPENSDKGLYILTASYTSSSTLRGQYIVMLDIE